MRLVVPVSERVQTVTVAVDGVVPVYSSGLYSTSVPNPLSLSSSSPPLPEVDFDKHARRTLILMSAENGVKVEMMQEDVDKWFLEEEEGRGGEREERKRERRSVRDRSQPEEWEEEEEEEIVRQVREERGASVEEITQAKEEEVLSDSGGRVRARESKSGSMHMHASGAVDALVGEERVTESRSDTAHVVLAGKSRDAALSSTEGVSAPSFDSSSTGCNYPGTHWTVSSPVCDQLLFTLAMDMSTFCSLTPLVGGASTSYTVHLAVAVAAASKASQPTHLYFVVSFPKTVPIAAGETERKRRIERDTQAQARPE